RRYVNYSNLPPGDYRFRVIAGNDDGVWSGAPATLSFHIAAPFWRTGWFIGVCLFSLAALLYIFYRYRLGQALKIERLRTKISTDLHDDIGSTLSSISIMSDMTLQESRTVTPAIPSPVGSASAATGSSTTPATPAVPSPAGSAAPSTPASPGPGAP